MNNIGYEQLSIVLETWDAARFGSNNFDSTFGMVALKKLFELQPRAKQVFGYDKSEEEGNKKAQVHARAFAVSFDSVFQILGPDLELTVDILNQIGRRHKSIGVHPSLFPFMGEAIISTLQEFLGRPLTDQQRDAWEEVVDSICSEITKAILS